MLLYRLIIIFVLLFSNIGTTQMDNNILAIMSTSQEIIIYQDGTETEIDSNNKDYTRITNELLALSNSCRECPAFGVALHNETVEAMKDGLWIEFKFDKNISHNEMPFEALLIQVVGEYTGFNIIRKYDDKYEGRCFYVDLLDTDLASLENLLESII